MKVIVTTIEPDLGSAIDPRFGRASYYLSIDPESMTWEALPNQARTAPGGAGVQAAQFVAEHGASAVISGAFGPNAFRALDAAEVEMYLAGAAATAKEAVDSFLAQELECVGAPTRPGRPR